VVDVWLEDVEAAPLAGLVDSGALRTRFPRDLAELAGVDLDLTSAEDVVVGGVRTHAVPARVNLRLGAGEGAYRWDCAVWFCDPWPLDFALLGLQGFLQHFRVTLSAYHEWLDCVPGV
jgi:hypothetical protein